VWSPCRVISPVRRSTVGTRVSSCKPHDTILQLQNTHEDAKQFHTAIAAPCKQAFRQATSKAEPQDRGVNRRPLLHRYRSGSQARAVLQIVMKIIDMIPPTWHISHLLCFTGHHCKFWSMMAALSVLVDSCWHPKSASEFRHWWRAAPRWLLTPMVDLTEQIVASPHDAMASLLVQSQNACCAGAIYATDYG
jgi:hypothetical protein